MKIPSWRLLAGACGFVVATYVGTLTGQSTSEPVHSDLQTYMAARTAAWANVQSFTFGVYSDIHMMENPSYGLTRPQWQRLLTTWRDSRHLFGMIVGDLGYGDASHVQNVLSGPIAVPDAPPVFYQMGNHELDGIGKRPWIDALYPNAVAAASWRVQAQTAPGNADQAYYSFDIGPFTHFIVLDGDYVTFDGYNARIRQRLGQAQLQWLAADIKANPNRNILVFVHEPVDQQINGSTPNYTLTDKGGVLDLLSAHPKQAFIFSGHFHGLRGGTRWRGVTSVHVMTGSDPNYGVSVQVDGDQVTVIAGPATAFDQHPMNNVRTTANGFAIDVAEDGTSAGFTRDEQMVPVAAERGVLPTAGSLMLRAGPMTWYAPKFISEQLIKITPGMKFSYDIYLMDVVNGLDAVTVQPSWYMKNGTLPPAVVDQNGIALSRRTNDGLYMLYNEDTPSLLGLATNRWYHRDFDLTSLAGNYVDGLYLTGGAPKVNVGTIYVDNIKFTWAQNTPPAVSLTSPVVGAAFGAPATINMSAPATDADGWVSGVEFRANGQLLATRSATPFVFSWTAVPAGSYNLTAVAIDNLGARTSSAPVRITVGGAAPPTTATQTVLGNSAAATEYLSSGNFELGMRFFSAVPGQITGVRFWKAQGETGQHIGRIWSTTGQLLASVPFSAETASGWQQQLLGVPLNVAANVEYIISVNTTDKRFAATNYGFTTERISGDLHAPAGNNGLFAYGTGTLPNTAYASTNYFRDVMFVADSAGPPPAPQPPATGVTTFGSVMPASEVLSNANANFELGMRLFSTVPGQITAVRFWKAQGESGPHVGRLWSAWGQLLASVIFSNETATGWQEQLLTVPLAIAANTEYVVSVNTTSNLIPITTYAFLTEKVSGLLHVPGGNNGLFSYTVGTLPTFPYASSNYFRDVRFVPN